MNNNKRKNITIYDALILLVFICFFCFNRVSISNKYNLYLYFVPVILLFVITTIKIVNSAKILQHALWYLLFFIYACFSMMWSDDIRTSIRFLKMAFISLMFIISLVEYIDSKEKMNRVINYFIIGLVCMIIRLAFTESFAFNFKRKELFGTAIGFYKNDIAMSLMFGIVFLHYKFVKENKKICYILIPIFSYVMILANSRKVIVFLVLYITLYYIFESKNNLKSILKNFIIVLGIFIFVIAFLYYNPYIYDRLEKALQTYSNKDVEDESAMERRFYRITAIELFKDSPILGVGINGFAEYLERINYGHVAYSHSNWLELLCTLGIVGFVIYYYQYYILMKKAISQCLVNKNQDCVVVLVFIMCLFLLEYAFVSYLYLHIQTMIVIMHYLLIFNQKKKIIEEKEEQILIDGGKND